MFCILSPRSLLRIAILSTTVSLMWADKSIGDFLRRQITSYIRSTSNNTNHQLWMKHLEKRLNIICRNVNKQQFREKKIFSILQFYSSILKNNMLNKMSASKNVSFHNIIQIGIFGSVKASPEDVAAADMCMRTQDEEPKKMLYIVKGKVFFSVLTLNASFSFL